MLLVVAAVMFHAGRNAVLLQTVHILAGHCARKIGIFRKIFEISPVERIALDIYARRKQNIHVLFLAVVGQRLPHSAGKLSVPGIRKTLQCGISNRLKGNLFAVFPYPFHFPHAVRSVAHQERRDFSVQTASIPGTLAAKQAQFFFNRQFVQFHHKALRSRTVNGRDILIYNYMIKRKPVLFIFS